MALLRHFGIAGRRILHRAGVAASWFFLIMQYPPLSRDDVVSVIEGKGCAARVPNLVHFWTNPNAYDEVNAQKVRELLARYPYDAQILYLKWPDYHKAPEDDPEYRWMNFDAPTVQDNVAHDERVLIKDWAQLDDIIKVFPKASYPSLFTHAEPADGRYRLCTYWFCFFERLWSFRGMTNALMDFYEEPDRVHQLFDVLTNFYCDVIERAVKEQGIDGMFTSDDIGTQTSTFFSDAIFDEFFRPYYKRVIDCAHKNGVHFWLHTCGNVRSFIPKFIEMGLDVLHPIQKYTMDEREIAQEFGKDICVWAGFDVQQVIPWGTPEEVRAEVRFLIDTFARPEGRLMLTCGNGITPDCKVESLEALLDEITVYGAEVCGKYRK